MKWTADTDRSWHFAFGMGAGMYLGSENWARAVTVFVAAFLMGIAFDWALSRLRRRFRKEAPHAHR